MKTVVLINGLKRSGKDYSASELQKMIPNSETMFFSAPMKRILATTFGITLEALDLYKNESDKYFLSFVSDIRTTGTIDFREILQRFGSEAMKPEFGANVWGELMIKNVKESKSDVIIISDFRFLTELQAMKDNFKVITVKVQGKNTSTDDLHVSETELLDLKVDYLVDNSEYDGRLQKELKLIAKGILSVDK